MSFSPPSPPAPHPPTITAPLWSPSSPELLKQPPNWCFLPSFFLLHLTSPIILLPDWISCKTAPTDVYNPPVFPIGNRTKSNPQPGIQGLLSSDSSFSIWHPMLPSPVPGAPVHGTIWGSLSRSLNTLPLYWLFLHAGILYLLVMTALSNSMPPFNTSPKHHLLLEAIFHNLYSSPEGDGHPLQNSCLENPMDRGAWRAIIVHGVAKSGT